MWIFALFLFLPTALAYVETKRKLKVQQLAGNPKQTATDYKRLNLWFWLTLASLVCFSGLRSRYNDTGTYVQTFQLLYYNNFRDYLANFVFQGDWAFDFVGQVIKCFVRNNYHFLLFFYAALTIFLVTYTLYQNSEFFVIPIFLYVTMGLYMASMAAVRQCFAASLIFAASPLVEKRDWKRFFLVVLLAAQFHNTAYVFLLVYFVMNLPAWKKTWVFFVGGFLAIIVYLISSSFFFSLFGSSRFAVYGTATEYSGASPIRIVVEAVPLFLAYYSRKEITPHEKLYHICVNMSMLNLIFTILSTFIWIFFRFTYYTSLYNVLLLTWGLYYFKDKTYQKALYFFAIIFYSIYYFYSNLHMGANYMSDILHLQTYI